MATKKRSASTSRKQTAQEQPSSAYRELDTLLHTVRCIAQYEDALCELAHETKQTGVLSDEASSVLDTILKKIPSHDYVHDLAAVTELLAASQKPAGSALKRRAKPAPARKKSTGAKKSG